MILALLYEIRTRSLVYGDKISVKVDVNRDVYRDQKSEIDAGATYNVCQDISKINLVLTLSPVCNFKPIDGYDGRIWGRIIDEDGTAVSPFS